MDFIRERTEGFEELAEIVKDYTPEKAAEICHIDAEDIRKAARMYARAKKSTYHILSGSYRALHRNRGRYEPFQSCHGGRKIGKSGCGINPLRGQNNVQGACDMGCMPYDFRDTKRWQTKKFGKSLKGYGEFP